MNLIKNKNANDKHYIYMGTFILACFIGWIFETIFTAIYFGYLQDRGMMVLPFLPIYGFGALLILIILKKPKPGIYNKIIYFISAFFVTSILEFFTGFALDKIFHNILWEYNTEFLNIMGYVCLKASLVWGIFAIVYMLWIQPLFTNLLLKIPKKYRKNLIITTFSIFIIDYSINLIKIIINIPK